jgi:hypothetical protein
MITRISEIIHEWMGWCPNANARPLRTATPVITAPQSTVNPAQPGGGAGGPGRLDRGVDLALGSLRILFGNARLLWFPVLSGIVLAFSVITTFGLQYLSGTTPFTGSGLITEPQVVLIAKGSLVWLSLTFATQWVTTFAITLMLAGLITSVSYLFSGRTATLREVLSNTVNHLRPLAGWATVFAAIGTIQSIVLNLYPGNIFLVFFLSLLMIPLGILTIFVVPVIILEGTGLAGAVAGSLSIIRKTWGEILVCFFVYIVLWFIVALVTLIPVAAIAFPSGNPALISLFSYVYMLALMVMIMIYMAADGIFLFGLYTYAKTGRVPGMFVGKQDVNASV